MWQEQPLLIPADHPSAPGHFPGRPIIPGALLLDAVLAAIAPQASALTVRTAKFLHPAAHGTSLTLRWQADGPAAWRFECAAGGTMILTGILSAEAPR